MQGVSVRARLQGEQAVLVEDCVGLGLRRPLGIEGEIGPHGQAEVAGLGERFVGVPFRYTHGTSVLNAATPKPRLTAGEVSPIHQPGPMPSTFESMGPGFKQVSL